MLFQPFRQLVTLTHFPFKQRYDEFVRNNRVESFLVDKPSTLMRKSYGEGNPSVSLAIEGVRSCATNGRR